MAEPVCGRTPALQARAPQAATWFSPLGAPWGPAGERLHLLFAPRRQTSTALLGLLAWGPCFEVLGVNVTLGQPRLVRLCAGTGNTT